MQTVNQGLHAIGLALSSCLLWWLVFAGWGMMLARACGRRVRTGEELIWSFWAGWSIVLVFLILWHFFWRVDGAVAIAVAGGGLGGLLAGARRLRPVFLRWTWRKAILGILFVLLAAWKANHTTMTPLNYDTGLYHLPQMQWIATYRIVPGLGNLHGRLAFNQSYFLYAAMLNTGPWRGVAWHWPVLPLLLTLVVQVGLKLTGRTRPGEGLTRRLFWLLLAVPVLDQLNNFNISSPTPDMAIFLISIVIAIDLLDLLMMPVAATRGLFSRVIRITLLGMVGITVKFNFLLLGGGAAALALGIGAARLARRGRGGAARRLAAVCTTGALLILGAWAARDVILSGWIAYPLPLLPCPVPWRLPMAAVAEEIETIYGYGRDPVGSIDRPIRGWAWLPTWSLQVARFQRFETLLPLGLIGICLAVALYQRRCGVAADNRRAMWLFLSIPIMALVYWFMTSPHPRFASGTIWVLTAGSGAFVLARFGQARRRLAYGLAALMMLVAVGMHNRHIPLVPPGPNRGFHPPPAVSDAIEYVTDYGLLLYSRSFETRWRYQCWEMPLPHTPFPKRKLRLIRPGDLQRGFILDGPLMEPSS